MHVSLRTALFALVCFVSPVVAQERPALTPEQQARLTIRPVPGQERLYVLPGFDGSMSGGNVAVLVTARGVVLVDNKFSYSYPDIARQVATVTEQPFAYVFNTHHHADHAGSNQSFRPDAAVIGHANVRNNMLRNDQPGLPNVTFESETRVIAGDDEIRAFHFGRGHTNGDAVVLFVDQRVLHTGDLFIVGERLDGSKLAPFIDYANGGSAASWTATLDQILELDFDTVIPGHGPILTKADVREFRNKMEQLVARVGTALGRGVTRDEIAAAVEVSDLDWPLAKSRLQAIYDELAPLVR